MSAACVPWYVPRCNMGLSKHGNRVFPHSCPLNQNLARVGTGGVGYHSHAVAGVVTCCSRGGLML